MHKISTGASTTRALMDQHDDGAAVRRVAVSTARRRLKTFRFTARTTQLLHFSMDVCIISSAALLDRRLQYFLEYFERCTSRWTSSILGALYFSTDVFNIWSAALLDRRLYYFERCTSRWTSALFGAQYFSTGLFNIWSAALLYGRLIQFGTLCGFRCFLTSSG